MRFVYQKSRTRKKNMIVDNKKESFCCLDMVSVWPVTMLCEFL